MNLISRFWVVITKYWYRGTIKRVYKLITYAYTINEYQIAFSSYQTQHKLNLCLQYKDYLIFTTYRVNVSIFSGSFILRHPQFTTPLRSTKVFLIDWLPANSIYRSRVGRTKNWNPMVATMLLADKGELGPSVFTRLENIYFISVEVVTKAYCNGTVSDLSDLILWFAVNMILLRFKTVKTKKVQVELSSPW